VAAAVSAEAETMPAGQLAVLHAAGHGDILGAVKDLVPEASDQAGPGRRVVVLDVKQAKGLEFDRVILVEPAAIVAAGVHGLGDLYVAMTRATQQLGIVHSVALPAEINPALLERRD
jgi:hypothetical protein